MCLSRERLAVIATDRKTVLEKGEDKYHTHHITTWVSILLLYENQHRTPQLVFCCFTNRSWSIFQIFNFLAMVNAIIIRIASISENKNSFGTETVCLCSSLQPHKAVFFYTTERSISLQHKPIKWKEWKNISAQRSDDNVFTVCTHWLLTEAGKWGRI